MFHKDVHSVVGNSLLNLLSGREKMHMKYNFSIYTSSMF